MALRSGGRAFVEFPPPGGGGPRDPRLTATDLLDAATDQLSTAHDRLRGYLDALGTVGAVDPSLVMTGPQTTDGAADFLRAALAGPQPPTAVFATETTALLGALHALRAEGLRCPDDVSVIGFDDSPWARLTDPPLTVVAQPVEAMGRAAAQRLLARLRGSGTAVGTTVIPSALVHRGSLAPPPVTARP